MITRRNTKPLEIGNVQIGGNSPVSIQSMTKTPTSDIESTLKQINSVQENGCEIIRCAVPDMDSAIALKDIVSESPIPVIADIHFHHELFGHIPHIPIQKNHFFYAFLEYFLIL